MIEGLWIVRFVRPEPEPLGILSGVVVIETSRILGGDSGYLYIGEIGDGKDGSWPVTVRIIQHDKRMQSIFGDKEDYTLQGTLRSAPKSGDHETLALELGRESGVAEILVSLTKAADLP